MTKKSLLKSQRSSIRDWEKRSDKESPFGRGYTKGFKDCMDEWVKELKL